jgi:hypothetical protein
MLRPKLLAGRKRHGNVHAIFRRLRRARGVRYQARFQSSVYDSAHPDNDSFPVLVRAAAAHWRVVDLQIELDLVQAQVVGQRQAQLVLVDPFNRKLQVAAQGKHQTQSYLRTVAKEGHDHAPGFFIHCRQPFTQTPFKPIVFVIDVDDRPGHGRPEITRLGRFGFLSHWSK